MPEVRGLEEREVCVRDAARSVGVGLLVLVAAVLPAAALVALARWWEVGAWVLVGAFFVLLVAAFAWVIGDTVRRSAAR